jgi:hypothetical protein
MAIYGEDQMDRILANANITPQLREQGPAEQEQEISFIDAAKGAITDMNAEAAGISGMLRNLTQQGFDPQEGFSAISKMSETDTLDFYEHLIGTRSDAEFDFVLNNIQREQQSISDFRESKGASFLGALGVGIATSPSNWIAGFNIAKRATRLGTVLGGARSGAAFGAGIIGVQEKILQEGKLTQTEEETLHNIAVGTAVSGLLGGTLGLFVGRAGSKAFNRRVLGGALDGEEVKFKDPTTTGGKLEIDNSVGAARSMSDDDFDLYFKGGKSIESFMQKVYKGVGNVTRIPSLRGFGFGAKSVKQFTDLAYNHPFNTKFAAKGESQGAKIESIVDTLNKSDILELHKGIKDDYYDFIGAKGGRIDRAKAQAGAEMKLQDYSEAVYEAQRTGVRSDIDHINRSVQRLDSAYKKVAARAVKEGIIESDDIIARYAPIMWDFDKVFRDIRGFEDKLRVHISRTKKDAFGNDIEELTSLRGSEFEQRVEQEVNKIRDDLFRSKGSKYAHGISESAHKGFLKGGQFTKKRIWDLPYDDFKDFQVRDSFMTSNVAIDQLNRAIAFKRKIRDAFGVESYNDLLAKISDEYNELAELNPARTSELAQEAAKAKAFVADTTDALFDRIRSTSGKWLRYLNSYQSHTMLGMVLPASVPDLVLLPFRQGFKNTMMHGMVPVMKQVKEMVTGIKSGAIDAKQAVDLSLALESEMDGLLQSMVDGTFASGEHISKLGRFMTKTNKFFGLATGIQQFDDAMRSIAGQVSSATLIRDSIKVAKGTATETDILKLARKGISKQDALKIKELVDNGTIDKVNGSYITDPRTWRFKGAEDLAERYEGALALEANVSGLRPAKSAIPLGIQKSHWAGAVAFMRRFMFMATERTVMSGAQRAMGNEAATVASGVMGLIGMGIMLNMARYGKTYDTNKKEDMYRAIYEGAQVSGVIGLMELPLSLNPFSTVNNRFAGRNATATILGAHPGLINDAAQAMARIADGDITDKDLKKLKRFIPYQNWLGLELYFRLIDEE